MAHPLLPALPLQVQVYVLGFRVWDVGASKRSHGTLQKLVPENLSLVKKEGACHTRGSRLGPHLLRHRAGSLSTAQTFSCALWPACVLRCSN